MKAIIESRRNDEKWMLVLVALFCFCGCSTKENEILVEVEPGKFEKIEKIDRSESTKLIIQGNGEEIVWDEKEIPVLLRRFRDEYYVIGYDQATDFDFGTSGRYIGNQNLPKIFRYFAQKGNRIVPIDKASFPPQIAYQNMWIQGEELRRVLRDRDISSQEFRQSVVPLIWADILDEYPKSKFEISEDLFERYVGKHNPEKLTFSPPR